MQSIGLLLLITNIFKGKIMPIFIIRASEQVFYHEEIQAKTRDEAIEKFYDMACGSLEPCDSDNFTIDDVEEEGDD
jgi:hypothetical protein